MMTTIFGGGDGSSEEVAATVAATATAEVVTEADFKVESDFWSRGRLVNLFTGL